MSKAKCSCKRLLALLYKAPSNSTGKNFVANVYVLQLPAEFITKYFEEVI